MVGTGAPTDEQRLGRGAAVIGGLVAAYAVFDTLVLLLTLALLITRFDPLGVYVWAIVTISVINIACCRWLDRRWELWAAAGHARRLETRLVRLRDSHLMRRPVAWITSGSLTLFALAAGLVNPVIVVGAARAIGGQPIGDRRVIVASISYAVMASSLYLVVAIAIRGAVRSLA